MNKNHNHTSLNNIHSEHCTDPKVNKKSSHKQHDKHDKHAGHSVAMFKDKFWWCLALTIPVLLYSNMIQDWFNFVPPMFIGSELVALIFSTIIFFYGGMVFIKSAIVELKSKKPGMMTLISLAIITAFVYSVATQFWLNGEGFFWELATLVTIMLLGHWLEMASIAKAENALDAISKLLPDKAEKLINGKPKLMLVSELKVGDLVLARPGSSIPVDGVVTEGSSSVNESAITGESKPISKSINDEVVAGTINQDGSLTVKVTKLGDDTTLAGIMRLVAEAQNSKSKTQVLADKAAFVLTVIAIATSIITFIYWAIAKDSAFALGRSVTVLIIACPHALGLAIPLVVSISTVKLASNGLLVRKRTALETSRKINWVLFDKTGTLTKGEHGVTDIWPTVSYSKDDILQLTASLEQKSEHIIARGILNAASKSQLKLNEVMDFSAIPGFGVKGTLHGQDKYVAASKRYIKEKKINVPKDLALHTKQASKEGKTEVYLIKQDTIIGVIALADMVREQSKQVVAKLKEVGIKTAMVTGDSQDVAVFVSRQLGINHFFAEINPEKKADKVKELQKNGNIVAFVGDGINDAPALTTANIGMAIGAGTDVAIKSADIILVKNDPTDVLRVIQLSRATYNKMLQNLVWATGYNVLAIPLAAGILYSFGIMLSPAIGAVLMTLSTIIVAVNAQLLRRVEI